MECGALSPAGNKFGLAFLKRRSAQVLTAALALHLLIFNVFSRTEIPSPHRPLRELPARLSGWRMVHDGVVSQEVQEVLRADETLTRVYERPGPQSASLFVAYFNSQRTGVNPHSPKNCLPGAGWLPLTSDTISIPLPGRPRPVEANRFLIAKGDAKNLVLYWYQSRDRSVASEYAAKIYLVLDAIRWNRTDTALIRISVLVIGNNVDDALNAAIAFAQDSFGPLRSLLPS